MLGAITYPNYGISTFIHEPSLFRNIYFRTNRRIGNGYHILRLQNHPSNKIIDTIQRDNILSGPSLSSYPIFIELDAVWKERIMSSLNGENSLGSDHKA